MPQQKECDAYIIDTIKMLGKFVPGAITYAGRKRIQTIQWKENGYDSQEEADEFVRRQFISRGLAEANNEGELRRA